MGQAQQDSVQPATSILVVDDERLIRWSLRERLSQDGYAVTVARSMRQALERLADPVALAVLDVHLPDGDGLSLAEAIRERHPHCLVVLMTAYGTAEIAREAYEKGAFRVVDKPFKLDAMARLVEEAIGRGM